MGLASACGSAHHVAVSPTSIVFESARGCQESFYGVRPDGTGLTRILTARHCADVYWKQDGRSALVIPQDSRDVRPYTVDTRTGKQRQVRVPGLVIANYPPDQPWSPNGK